MCVWRKREEGGKRVKREQTREEDVVCGTGRHDGQGGEGGRWEEEREGGREGGGKKRVREE